MAQRLIIAEADLVRLYRQPGAPVDGEIGGVGYRATVTIPNYADKVATHYGADPRALSVPFDFLHFGFNCAFEAPIELEIYDGDRVLDGTVRGIVERFGPVILSNAYLPRDARLNGQRNIFSSLSFHVDRGRTQADCYSLFCRDPFDAAQSQPRTSSTLILASRVAYLQALKEGAGAHEFKSLYQLFEGEDLAHVVGSIVLEHAWQEPEGTGEICILDNRSVLHASFYRRQECKGYSIGVRYLY